MLLPLLRSFWFGCGRTRFRTPGDFTHATLTFAFKSFKFFQLLEFSLTIYTLADVILDPPGSQELSTYGIKLW